MEAFRKHTYPDTSVFIVCFDTTDRVSFESAQNHWVNDISKSCPDAIKILVGTKSDLRDKKIADGDAENCVTDEEAKKVAGNDLSFKQYLSCSALTGTGVNSVYFKAMQVHK